jgi:phage protein U
MPTFLRTNIPVIPRRAATSLTQGLTFLVLPGMRGAVDLVSGRQPNRRGMTVAGVNYPEMTGGQAGTSADQGLYYGSGFPIPSGSNTYSIAAYCKPSSVTRRSHLFTQGDPVNAPFPQVTFAANSNASATATAGQFAMYQYNSSFQAAVTTANTMIDGDWHTFVGTRNGGTPSLYRDGVNVSSGSSGTAATVVNGTYVGACGGVPGASLGADYPVALVAVWDRALSAEEVAFLSRNPFTALFAPAYGPLWMVESFGVTTSAPTFNAAWARGANTVISNGAMAA